MHGSPTLTEEMAQLTRGTRTGEIRCDIQSKLLLNLLNMKCLLF
jgi:hypothetical protein